MRWLKYSFLTVDNGCDISFSVELTQQTFVGLQDVFKTCLQDVFKTSSA